MSRTHATDPERFRRAIERIDALNSEDPVQVRISEREVPGELLYSQRMSARLQSFAPEASEELRLAAHCQHVQRWKIPRDAYPRDRKGYKCWRTELGRMHADIAGEVLRGAGYGEDSVARVQMMLRKEKLKKDPEVQTLEDVICLVFLEHYFADFAAGHPREKLINILRKTWNKMSPPGHEAALALDLPPDLAELVQAALAGD